MGFFPLYRDNLLRGPSYVSLSIPPIPSAILKSLNIEGNSSFLLPNIDYIKKVLNGDLGISDTATKNMIFKQINSPMAIGDLSVIKKYSEISGLKLPDSDFSKYKKGNVFRIPKSDITPPEELVGFKSLEMVTLKSIFETQKPYIEIAKIILDSFGSIEDIVARVMPLASSNPLTHRSKKPVVNSGSGSRPKSIGFAGGMEMKQSSSDLKNLTSNKKNKNSSTTSNNTKLSTKQSEENVIDSNIATTSTSNYDDPVLRELSKNYKIINVQYSTGFFISGTDYQYSYVELSPDAEILNNQLESDPIEEDLYDKWKPKNLIFGIFDSKGLPVNPDEYLKTSGYSGNNKTEVTTPFKRVDWIVNNPKWKFKSGDWKWPVLGEPNYIFTNGIFNKVSKTKPDNSDIAPAWNLKLYKEGDKNLINKLDAQPGDPVIDSFDPIDKVLFQNYFKEYTELSFIGIDLSVDEKSEAIKTINSNLEIESHLENLSKYGQNKSSVYDTNFPETLKKTFSPYKIYVPESKGDPKLSNQNGMIWIDPESDYEMKIIKVTPVKKLNNKSDLNYEYKIKTYIKNILNIKLSDDSNFNVDFYKNSTLQESLLDVNNYILENWNIEGDKIVNSNDFKVNVWSSNPMRKYKNLSYTRWYDLSNLFYSSIKKVGDKWQYNNENPLSSKTTGYKKLDDDNTYVYVKDDIIQRWYYLYETNLSLNADDNFKLPGLAENKIISLDVNNTNISNETKTIPLYKFKVENNGYKVLDPSLLNNKFLSIPELYSKNSYGLGTKSNPQKLEIIERYQLTDLDTETYYIIEGSKIEDKVDNIKNKKSINGEDDSSWYRLPHAVGAFIPFIKLLIKIFSKLVPSINKLITLLSDPTSFITDIISEKLSESFPFLSKESFNTFKNLSEKLKNKDSIIKERGGSFYIDDIKKSLSPELKNLTFVNKYGIMKSPNNSSIVNSVNSSNTKIESLSNISSNTNSNSNLSNIKNSLSNFNLNDLIKNSPNDGFGIEMPISDIMSGFNSNNISNNISNNSNNISNNISNNSNNISNNISNNSNNIDNNFSLKYKMEDLWDKRPSILKNNENFGDFAFLLDGKSTIPFKVLGKEFNFGMELKMANLLYNKPPLKLIFDSNLGINKKTKKESNSPNTTTKPIGSNITGGGSLPPVKSNNNIDPKQFEIVSVWYSTGKYMEGVDYDYSYITIEEQQLLENVDELIETNQIENLEIAKDKLNNQLIKNKNNQPIKNKLSIVNKLLESLNSEIQPILKLVLSLVTTPLTIIGNIIQYILDFFKSLTNPVKLPIKIAEFLSFKWILDFFTPKGIMEIMGIKFKPELLPVWIGIASSSGLNDNKSLNNISTLNKESVSNPSKVINKSDNLNKEFKLDKNSDGTGSEISIPSGFFKDMNFNNISSKLDSLNSNVNSNSNNISSKLLSDDYELADLSQFFSAPFLPKLPTYTLGNFKQKIRVGDPLFPLKFVSPSLCFIEKIINGFIDFIWSLMGIEPLIKPPHIKLCPETTKPEDIQKILNGESPKSGEKTNENITEVMSTDPYVERVAVDSFVYTVKMPNGEIKEFIDRNSLDKFVEENKDINFEFDF